MIDTELVAMLRCPESGGQLEVAAPELVDRVNQLIKAGQARDRADQLVSSTIDGGLATAATDSSNQPEDCWVYPIRDDIPSLIIDEAIRVPAS